MVTLLVLAELLLLGMLLMMLLVPLALLFPLLIHVENYPPASSRLLAIPWIALELLVCGN